MILPRFGNYFRIWISVTAGSQTYCKTTVILEHKRRLNTGLWSISVPHPGNKSQISKNNNKQTKNLYHLKWHLRLDQFVHKSNMLWRPRKKKHTMQILSLSTLHYGESLPLKALIWKTNYIICIPGRGFFLETITYVAIIQVLK